METHSEKLFSRCFVLERNSTSILSRGILRTDKKCKKVCVTGNCACGRVWPRCGAMIVSTLEPNGGKLVFLLRERNAMFAS